MNWSDLSAKLQPLFEDLPEYLGYHMLLSVSALAAGLVVSIPMGVLASRRPKLSEYLLAIAGIMQTIPTLALLVIMVPVLGNQIGFMPAVVALILYSILPILASTITGIRGIDPTLVEAARGLGMNDWQMLTRVQLPLAAPVIISGVRTATVLVVGTATLATPVGGVSLGNYIFSGLEMNDMDRTIFGCLFTALFAILMDQLVHLLELGVARRSKPLAWVAALGFSIVVAGGLYIPVEKLVKRMTEEEPVIVASAPFTEQYILSAIMKKNLADAGFRVDQRQGMGETIQFIALKSNRIDCAINYTGNIWATQMGRTDFKPPEEVYRLTTEKLKADGIVCLGKIGFENNYVLAMRADDAARRGIDTIDDLGKKCGRMTIIGDRQFFARPEWRQLRDDYKLNFREQTSMDPNYLYDRIRAGKADVICAYSSDGRIEGYNLRKLDDNRKVLPRYHAILLLSPKAAKNAQLVAALQPLANDAISDEAMRSANFLVDSGKGSAEAAAELLFNPR